MRQRTLILFVALVGFVICATPLPAHADEAAQAFERYTGERVQILRARALRASTRPEVRPGADRPVITYRGVADHFDTDLEPTGVGSMPVKIMFVKDPCGVINEFFGFGR